MNVQLNGVERAVPDRSTVADLVRLASAPTTGIAVALDGEVVPRAAWGTVVPAGATVEILTAVQGG